MPDLERRLLAGRKSRALGTLPGCAAVGVAVFGLPFHWELAVRGEAAGQRLEAVFLVPVYERPS